MVVEMNVEILTDYMYIYIYIYIVIREIIKIIQTAAL